MKNVTWYFEQKTRWVVLYNEEQRAYHIETEDEYQHSQANGYSVIATADDYDSASNIASRYQRNRRP